MICVTRLNGNRFVLNAELIRTVEENPDTTITLVNGDHIIVREDMDEVIRLAIEYGRSLRRMMPSSEGVEPGPGRTTSGLSGRPTRTGGQAF